MWKSLAPIRSDAGRAQTHSSEVEVRPSGHGGGSSAALLPGRTTHFGATEPARVDRQRDVERLRLSQLMLHKESPNNPGTMVSGIVNMRAFRFVS